MDYLSRARVGAQSQTAGVSVAAEPHKETKQMKKGSKLVRVGAFAMLVSVVLLVVALLTFVVFGGTNEQSMVKKSQYQAVFLADQNGQVYFGHLTILNSRYYKLSDIYYVRVEQSQTGSTATQNSGQNVSLAKLGNELHGPEDTMYISRDKVLFWENLKTDGQVAKAISDYQKNGAKATATPAASSTAAPAEAAATATPKK